MRQLIVRAYLPLAVLFGLAQCGLGLLTPTFPAIGGIFVLSQLILVIVFAIMSTKVFRWMDREVSGSSNTQGREGKHTCDR